MLFLSSVRQNTCSRFGMASRWARKGCFVRTRHNVPSIAGAQRGGFAPWLGETADGGAQRARFALWLGEAAVVGAQRVVFAPRLGEMGNGGAQRARFAPWLGETADVGAQRARFAPWLGEAADAGAQRAGFAPRTAHERALRNQGKHGSTAPAPRAYSDMLGTRWGMGRGPKEKRRWAFRPRNASFSASVRSGLFRRKS